MPSPHLETALLLVIVPGVCLAHAPARRLAALGAVALALGAGSLRVAPGAMPLAEVARRAGELGLSPEALVVDGGFLVAGLLLASVAVVIAWRASAVPSARVGAIALGIGVALLAAGVMPLLLLAGPARATLAALLLVGVPWLVDRGASAMELGRRLRSWLRAFAPRPPGAWSPAASRWAGALALATLCSAALPTLWTVVAAAAVAALAAERLARARAAAPRWPFVGVAVLLVIAGAWALMVVTGERDPRIAALPEAPFSAAAEFRLAPALLASLWGFTGFAPFTRLVPGVSLAPAGLVVLVRVVLGAVPDGVDRWRPAVWMVVVLAMLVAAVQARRDLLLAGAATLALTSASADGVASALFLGGGGLLALGAPSALAARAPVLGRLGWGLAGWGAVLCVRGAIGREVVLTLLATVAVVTAMATDADAACATTA